MKATKILLTALASTIIVAACEKEPQEHPHNVFTYDKLPEGQFMIAVIPDEAQSNKVNFEVKAQNVTIDWGDGAVDIYCENDTICEHQYTSSESQIIVGTSKELITLSTLFVDPAGKWVELNVSGLTKLTKLYCKRGLLKSIDVSLNVALTNLNCRVNQITDLDLSHNTILKYLQCDGNLLESINVTLNKDLRALLCPYNSLTEIDISKNTKLQELNCENNVLTNLDVNNNTLLLNLGCSNNQLASLDVNNNILLDALTCRNNQLSSLDISKNSNLQVLVCSDNTWINSISTNNNPKLWTLLCYNCGLTNLDVSNNLLLHWLDCGNNLFIATALNTLFESLPVREYSDDARIFIESNSGAAECDKSIATDKGWKVDVDN